MKFVLTGVRSHNVWFVLNAALKRKFHVQNLKLKLKSWKTPEELDSFRINCCWLPPLVTSEGLREENWLQFCFLFSGFHSNNIQSIPEHAFTGNPSLITMWVPLTHLMYDWTRTIPAFFLPQLCWTSHVCWFKSDDIIKARTSTHSSPWWTDEDGVIQLKAQEKASMLGWFSPLTPN